jgi:hypothetical protein
MATNQEGRHQAVRDITGTSGSYNEDFLALFALSGFTTGTFNERFLVWLNDELGASHTSLPAAMQAYAVAQGANNWSSLNTITSGGGFALTAPVLVWDEETGDSTPDFTINFDPETVETDVVRFQIDDDLGFGSPIEVTNSLDAAEILAGEISLATGSLTDGTYYARARVEQPEDTPISGWSNIETITLAIPPSMTSSATFDVEDEVTLVGTLTATKDSTFAIGGTDAAFFEIQNGDELHFIDPPDFDTPQDAGADNDYDITITPTSVVGSLEGAAQNVTVTVTSGEDFMLVPIAGGLMFPYWNFGSYASGLIGGTNITLDATGEECAMVGRVYIDGRATGKTIDTTGSSAIQFRTSTVTFANGGSTFEVGIQDVATGAGPAARGDGSFDVKATLTGGGGGLTTTAWNTIVPTTGTKTLNHGDLIAVVFSMTARAGADSVLITVGSANANAEPLVNENVGGAGYLNTSTKLPNVILRFSDGTLGTIDFSHPASTYTIESFQDSTNPDERGQIFQVPWDCKVDALFTSLSNTDAGTDYTISLYSDPTGTPSSLASVTVLGEQIGGSTSSRPRFFTLPSEASLTADTDYCVAIRATGTSNLGATVAIVADTSHRVLYPGGTTLKKGTRNNGSGAFTPESPALVIYVMGVRISQVHTPV